MLAALTAAVGCGGGAADEPATREERGDEQSPALGAPSEGAESSVSDQIQEQIDTVEQRVAQNPQDAAALGELARLQY